MEDEKVVSYEKIKIGLADFNSCGWQQALDNIKERNYPSVAEAFSAAAKHAEAEKRYSHAKALMLLHRICFMHFDPNSPNEPLKPFIVLEGRRTAIPDDLPESDIEFLDEIETYIDNPLLKARVAEILWLRHVPRDVKHALDAIDAYRKISLDQETMAHDGKACWQRAINLTLMLKAGAGHRICRLQAELLAAFDKASYEDGFLALWLSELLVSARIPNTHAGHIAQKLESLGKIAGCKCEYFGEHDYISAAQEFYQFAKNTSKSAEMLVAKAECLEKKAANALSSATPTHMLALTFYNDALNIYRAIPRSNRAAYRIEERIERLKVLIADSGRHSLEELSPMETSLDIAEMVKNAIASVSSKPISEALRCFIAIHYTVKTCEMRKEAIEDLKRSPFSAMCSSMLFSQDGRIIARGNGADVDRLDVPECEDAITSEMIKLYRIHVTLGVQGRIWPALGRLRAEHRLRETFFIDMASRSPILPGNRAQSWGKALFAGYDNDFLSALHLLIPQIENLVRVYLKQTGIDTTHIDPNGVRTENGLSSLLDLPDAVKVLGENLAFEFKILFCDARGPNLRNELAHGLLDDDACESTSAVYVWWLMLRLVFNSVCKSEKQKQPS